MPRYHQCTRCFKGAVSRYAHAQYVDLWSYWLALLTRKRSTCMYTLASLLPWYRPKHPSRLSRFHLLCTSQGILTLVWVSLGSQAWVLSHVLYTCKMSRTPGSSTKSSKDCCNAKRPIILCTMAVYSVVQIAHVVSTSFTYSWPRNQQ